MVGTGVLFVIGTFQPPLSSKLSHSTSTFFLLRPIKNKKERNAGYHRPFFSAWIVSVCGCCCEHESSFLQLRAQRAQSRKNSACARNTRVKRSRTAAPHRAHTICDNAARASSIFFFLFYNIRVHRFCYATRRFFVLIGGIGRLRCASTRAGWAAARKTAASSRVANKSGPKAWWTRRK